MAFDCTSLDKVPITTSFIPTPILIANYADSNKKLHQIYPESARIQDQWGLYYIHGNSLFTYVLLH